MCRKDNKGVVRFKIPNFKDLTNKLKTNPVEIGNVKWTLGAFTSTSERTNNVKQLGVFLTCNELNKSNLWTCDASVRLSLVKLNSNDPNEAFSMDYEKTFNARDNEIEVPNFKNWQEATNYDNRFVVSEEAVVEAHITINKVVGIHEKILEQFTEPQEHLTDVVLIVEGKKVHVGRQILALNSQFFRALFYSNFSENSQNEITIEDLVHSEFVDFLNFIYPTHKCIDEKNVAHILKLADRFDAPFVLEKCEKFVITSTGHTLVEKFKLAEMYKLSELQNHCLSQLKSKEDVLKLGNFECFGDVSRFVLLEKVIEILTKG